jgi:hypothetical protein
MKVADAEKRFLDDLRRIQHSADNALYPIYYLDAFGEISRADETNEITIGLDKHVHFWRVTISSWQCAYIVGLGRAYDRGRDCLRLGDLIEFAMHYKGIFDHRRLRQRVFEHLRRTNTKEIGSGLADAFIVDLPAVTEELFHPLQQELINKRKLYQDKIEPIRSEYVAHLAADPSVPLSALFERTTSEEITDLLEFPLRLHDALWMFYHNGLAPVLRPLNSSGRTAVRNNMTMLASTLHLAASRDRTG